MVTRAPDLHIPASKAIVQVSIIDTTARIDGISTDGFLLPKITGYDYLSCPAFSFIIEHSAGKKVLFDLGVRKDWENFSPSLYRRITSYGWQIVVQKDVRDILEEENIDLQEINAIIWSHHHWDHTGDPSRFPTSADLVVGPGFKEAFMPGYPEKEDSSIRVSDYEGRKVYEVPFDEKPLMIGNFPAYDFFGDGSFYILDAPGHDQGHICGLARTTTGSDGDTFILMGGDFSHQAGEFRPSPYLPLPESITPHPFHDRKTYSEACPGAMFEKVHPTTLSKNSSGAESWRTEPFFRPSADVSHNIDDTIKTIQKVQEADGHDQVFVVMAHDNMLLDIVDLFPKSANDWKEKGWARDSKWAFLKDFQKAVELSGK